MNWCIFLQRQKKNKSEAADEKNRSAARGQCWHTSDDTTQLDVHRARENECVRLLEIRC